MKALVTSDLHLSERIWTREHQITQDSFHSWEQIVDLAVEHAVDTVILAGDILDKQLNLSRVISQLATGLSRLQEHEIRVWFIQGQHDMQECPWLHTVPGTNTTWLKPTAVLKDIGAHTVVGADYMPRDKFQEFLQSDAVKKASVLICHQVWQEFMGNVGNPQASFNDVPDNVKYVITGDYHETLQHKHERPGGVPLWVFSPGSTHIRSVMEPEDKSVFLLDFSAPKLKASILPLVTRRVLDLSTKKDKVALNILAKVKTWLAEAEEYAEQLPGQLKLPVVRLKYYPSEEDLAMKLRRELEGRAHYFPVLIPTASADDQVDDSVWDKGEKISIQDVVDRHPELQKKPKVRKLLDQLLAGVGKSQPSQVLAAWLSEEDDAD
jgi:DNA repair exonuclease SbcCD nuclease subunit